MKRIILIIFSSLIVLQVNAQQRIKSVEFSGNETLSDEDLLNQMNTKAKEGFQRLLFWKKKPELILPALESDIDRLKSYYIRNGFADAEISFDVDSLRQGKQIVVNIFIAENSFVRIGRIEINIDDADARYVADSLERVIPVKEGFRFRDEDVFNTVSIIKSTFSDNGYPFIKVSYEIKMHENNSAADISFNVDPGSLSYFGSMSIRGDSLFPESLISKYVLFSEGEVYNQSQIDSTQQDLFSTDLFRYVVIASKKDSSVNDRIPVEIIVNELPRWKLEAGIGYGSEDKMRLAGQITRLNFLGGIRRLIINAKTSYFLPFSFDVRFVQPDLFIPRLDLVVNPFIMREREISYSIDRMGGSINFIWQVRRHLTSHFSYSFEYDRLRELSEAQLDPEELRHNKSVFTLGGDWNSSDNIFYPSKGFRIEGTASYAGLGYSSASKFYKLQLSFIKYYSISRDFVLATKLSGGVLQTTSARNTPIEERYFLGGANSLRGWGRHRISPVNESGLSLGGNTMAEGSAELRFPIYELLHGVFFIDAGNVWRQSYVLDSDLHYNTGLGLRFRTPIGPLRLDLATPVINDDFNLQFFISVGHAF